MTQIRKHETVLWFCVKRITIYNNNTEYILYMPDKYLQAHGVEISTQRKVNHLLVVVVRIVVVGAALHLGRGVGDDAVNWGVKRPACLLWHQQGRAILNTPAFLHIVHLQQDGKSRESKFSRCKQTAEALKDQTSTRPRFSSNTSDAPKPSTRNVSLVLLSKSFEAVKYTKVGRDKGKRWLQWWLLKTKRKRWKFSN